MEPVLKNFLQIRVPKNWFWNPFLKIFCSIHNQFLEPYKNPWFLRVPELVPVPDTFPFISTIFSIFLHFFPEILLHNKVP
jgi:hypothetical protein